MNRVILVNGNKVGWAAALTALSFGISVFPLVRMSGVEIGYLTTDDLIRRLLILPLTVSFYVFVACFALTGFDSARAEVRNKSKPASAGEERGAMDMAQVVGVIWLNPLCRPDYPTEWRILWTLGLMKQDQGRDWTAAGAKPGALRPVLTVARHNREGETFHRTHESYIDEMFRLLARGRFDGFGPGAEIRDIRLEYAIPAYRLDPVEVHEYVHRLLARDFASGSAPLDDGRGAQVSPHVNLTRGGANAGFASLNAALDYLQENPDKSVWVMNWDAPDRPSKGQQSSENMALLVLAGPRYEAQCEPLAWIGRAVTGSIGNYVPRPGAVRPIEAWRDTVAMAAAYAHSEVANIDYVIHDAGAGSDVAAARLGTLGRSLTEMLAAFDYRKQTFNTAARLGDMGAGSALTNIAMAIGRAHHVGNKVLVAGTTDSDRPVAVVVVPPERPDGGALGAVQFRARSWSSGDLPWWGEAETQASRDALR
ncbi:virulence factor [Paraburkholderia sp. NMBU_R16]|uniref:virulence factor n=1 Tax=Paraburkholderia sp. NMBU_R16 TaxID=2698676 RepID=UPI00156674E9|nr:virulence factor [Paraburkholderia sp. NMBU_R16]NRO94402.1 virulence factor [Paraburkholderia sp. NMBU_R16]